MFQIDIDGLADTFPPLKSLDAVPNNLPVQLTDFVGREDELEQAKRIIIDSRMLTILAPGGAGKTRLAIQAAADLATSYPDGAFFVDLAPVESSADIAQTTAESIGIALATEYADYIETGGAQPSLASEPKMGDDAKPTTKQQDRRAKGKAKP